MAAPFQFDQSEQTAQSSQSVSDSESSSDDSDSSDNTSSKKGSSSSVKKDSFSRRKTKKEIAKQRATDNRYHTRFVQEEETVSITPLAALMLKCESLQHPFSLRTDHEHKESELNIHGHNLTENHVCWVGKGALLMALKEKALHDNKLFVTHPSSHPRTHPTMRLPTAVNSCSRLITRCRPCTRF